MTKAVRGRILKDSNGDINEHLRNHIHLTNCIHLKNHMHKQSPNLSDRSILRDLVALQRSRSLRDPSASPPSWQSPSIVDLLPKIGRKSVNSEQRKLSESSNLAFQEAAADNAGEENAEGRSKIEDTAVHPSGDGRLKTLSEQLGDDSDKASSYNHERRSKHQGFREGSSVRGKRRKFRAVRRTRAAPMAKDAAQNDMSVASNSLKIEEGECDDQNVTKGPQNVCGIPWNWSRIHDRGKTFFDMAGRSFSCGASETKSRLSSSQNESNLLAMAAASDYSSSSEALPLLGENGDWRHIYGDHSDLASDDRSGRVARFHRNRHQSLTQKYIPRTFRDVVGQNLVVQALSNAVVKKKVGLLYVFYGPHGTGKTSCARVFARALNCQSADDHRPCGYCNSCVSHEKGKNRYIKEIRSISKFEFGNMAIHQSASQYRVFIFDECDNFSSDCWSGISKVIDQSPRKVVFILVCSSIEILPHIIISRCQKFFFPKLKDADVIYTLQWISSRENINIDKEALKLVASQSDGSLRDAQMTLEQLSLLEQKISVPLVQEFAGLVSEEKLVDLLDLALSADTVNTVKNLREIMETGVEPIALMSQLATFITDVLAGSYDVSKERSRRKFFRRQSLTKEDMEKLRQALKTLSEAEKQLRTCTDKVTWLTAALLQLAPEQNYLMNETPTEHSPLVRRHHGSKTHGNYEEIWLEVLQKIHSSSLRRFLLQEGKLVHVSYGAVFTAATVQLLFTSHANKMKAETLTSVILRAFESVLGTPVTMEIKSEHGGGQDLSGKGAEIVELPPSPREDVLREQQTNGAGEVSNNRSLVKGKVSLAHVIQQTEVQQAGWSRRKAVSIAEKLEQENLRLEPRSRGLLCWKTAKPNRLKISQKSRSRRHHSLLKFVPCGRCSSARSQR